MINSLKADIYYFSYPGHEKSLRFLSQLYQTSKIGFMTFEKQYDYSHYLKENGGKTTQKNKNQ